MENIEPLIREAQKGSQKSFEQLYDLFADRIFRYIQIKINDLTQAEDLLQETFIKCWRCLHQFKVPGNFQAWLYRIATNNINDYFRKLYRKPPALELNEEIEVQNSEDLNEQLSLKIETEQVKDALKLLPPKYAEVLELRFVQDFTIEETAGILKKTSLAIRVIQHRGLKKIREILKETYDFQYTKV